MLVKGGLADADVGQHLLQADVAEAVAVKRRTAALVNRRVADGIRQFLGGSGYLKVDFKSTPGAPQVNLPEYRKRPSNARRRTRPAREPPPALLIPSTNHEVPMRRWSFFVYGVFCHLLFLATYAYMAGFVGNFLTPKSLDSAPADGLGAVGFDILLIALFGLQHSIMARPWFKRIWTRLVPQPIERSTYVLFSCLFLFLLMWQWRGLDAVIWDVQHPLGRGLLWGLFAAGWFLVPAVTMMMATSTCSAPDRYGFICRVSLTRPCCFAHRRSTTACVIHVVGLGVLATPTMTLGHLILAAP
jgi:hypothetical protein